MNGAYSDAEDAFPDLVNDAFPFMSLDLTPVEAVPALDLDSQLWCAVVLAALGVLYIGRARIDARLELAPSGD